MYHTPCEQPATLVFVISAVLCALLPGVWIQAYPHIWCIPALLIIGNIAFLAAIASIPWANRQHMAAVHKDQAARQAAQQAANYRAAADGAL